MENFILDFFLLLGILMLPMPTTPFLIYLYTSYPIQEAGIMFFLASNLEHLMLYYTGFYSRLIHFKKITNRFPSLSKKSLNLKVQTLYEKVKEFSVEKLQNAHVYDIIVARWFGVHPIIVCLGLGRIKAKLSVLLISNNFFVFIDILFYWLLIGTGTFLFNRFFPETTIEEVLKIDYLYPLSIAFLVLIYVSYGLYKWRKSVQKKT